MYNLRVHEISGIQSIVYCLLIVAFICPLSTEGQVTSFPYFEDFENTIGSWSNVGGDDNNWTIQTGGTPSNFTGPNVAHNGDYYIYVESSRPNFNSTAYLDLDVDFSSLSNPKMKFYYHMYGQDLGDLYVDVFDSGWNLGVFSLNGQQQTIEGDPFRLAEVDLSAYSGKSNLTIRLRTETGTNYQSDVAIDFLSIYDNCTTVTGGSASTSGSIMCTTGNTTLQLTGQSAGTILWEYALNGYDFLSIAGATLATQVVGPLNAGNTYRFRAAVTNGCTTYSDTTVVEVLNGGSLISSYPHISDFEGGVGDWSNETDDSNDWIYRTGGTPSTGTGPSAAFDGTGYLFVESSSPNFNTTAHLTSAYDFSGLTGVELSFYYHMYGASMGDLAIDIYDNGWNLNVFTLSGEQQASNTTAWKLASIDLSAYVGKCGIIIRFRDDTGNSYQSDVAIDRVIVSETCGTVDGGDATLDATNLCSIGTVDLLVSGYTGGSSIQWQSSTDGVLFTDITGANTASYTTGTLSIGTTYSYRAGITNGCTSYSDTSIVNYSASTISTFPYSESFESGIGDWSNISGDSNDWTRRSGGTPSGNTGPNAAHDGTFYVYVESSNPNFNTDAFFETNFDFSSVNSPELSFYYHMYGSDMGTFYVDVLEDDWQLGVFTISGQQHANAASPWTQQTIDLSAYAGNCNLTIRLRVETGSNYRSDVAIDLIQVIDNLSVWTGNVSSDWSDPSNWQGGIPDCTKDVIIQDVSGVSGNLPQVSSGIVSAKNLTIESGASLTVTGSASINVCGNWINNGASNLGAGTVVFQGSVSQEIQGINAFNNLEINNSSGVAITSGSDSISGHVSITSGNFDTGNALLLLSNMAGTAGIAEITGGSISGTATVQRYVAAGTTQWRFMSSPVQGTTIEDWDDDIITSGFIGSDYPDFPSASNRFISIQGYDESLGTTYNDGFFTPTGSTSTDNGKGFWVYTGTSTSTTDPIFYDVTGVPNSGDISMPVSYNPVAGNPSDDGWNIVGNPYACSIDWDSPNWTKTNIAGPVYIWSPEYQQFATYVPGPIPGTGIGLLGGSRYIASSQAFLIQTTGTSPSLVARESVKTMNSATFIKSPVRIFKTVASGNGFKSEAALRVFEGTSDGIDEKWDALKVRSNNTQVPHLSFVHEENDFMLNSIPSVDDGKEIPMKLEVGKSGDYVLSFSGVNSFSDLNCLILEDLETEEFYDLRTQNNIEIYVRKSEKEARFILYIGGENPMNLQQDCFQGESSVFLKGGGKGPWVYEWKESQDVSFQSKSSNEELELIDVSTGLFTYKISDKSGLCAVKEQEFTITNAIPSVEFEINKSIIEAGENLSYQLNLTNYDRLEWNFGDGVISSELNPVHSYSILGNYQITLEVFKGECSTLFNQEIEVNQYLSSVDSEFDFTVQKNERGLWISSTISQVTEIRIFDLSGKELLHLGKKAIEANGTQVNVPQTLASGIYLVSIQSEFHHLTKRMKW